MPFINILGHDRQKKQLAHAWSSKRLAHAYLFTGAEGVGKRLMATALARLIFCDQQSGCGTCAACQRLAHNNHPDLHIIEPDGAQIKIEQIRELQTDLSHPPLEAPRRICIIDEAERLNPAAGNALLKTLEEPRADVLLILISAHPDKVMETIRSRCQRLPFARLDQALISTILTDKNINEEDSQIIAALSEGSLKKALGSDREYFLHQRIEIFKTITALSSASIVPMLEFAEKLAATKEQHDDLIWILLSCYRDLFLLVHQASPTLMTNIDMEHHLRKQAKKETPLSIQRKLTAILECRQHLLRNVNRQLALEVLLLRLVN